MVRDYFWGITELNQEKMTVAWNFLPPKIGKFILQILDTQKVAFKWNFRPKNMARTPPYANMALPPWEFV